MVNLCSAVRNDSNFDLSVSLDEPRLQFSLKPFSKGLAEPPRSAVAPRKARNSLIGISFFAKLFFFVPPVAKKKSGQ